MPLNFDRTTSAEITTERPDIDRQVGQALRSISRITALQRAAIPAGLLTILAYFWVRFTDPQGLTREVLLLVWQMLFWIGVLLAVPLRRNARKAAALNDVRALGGLLEALTAHHRRDEEELCSVITRLLLFAGEHDGDSLTARQLNILTGIPTTGPNRYGIPLIIAAIRAMEKIGDEGSLRAMEKAAAHADSPEVRKAAQDALPTLRARVERLKEAGQLLRPAGGDDSSLLLHPASAHPATDEQLLLRSTMPGA